MARTQTEDTWFRIAKTILKVIDFCSVLVETSESNQTDRLTDWSKAKSLGQSKCSTPWGPLHHRDTIVPHTVAAILEDSLFWVWLCQICCFSVQNLSSFACDPRIVIYLSTFLFLVSLFDVWNVIVLRSLSRQTEWVQQRECNVNTNGNDVAKHHHLHSFEVCSFEDTWSPYPVLQW